MIKWKINGLYKADATTVFNEISSLGEQYTPEEVVEKAKDESTELHKCFEWNDTIAAEKYRVIQARKIIQMLVVTNDTEKNPEEPPVYYRAVVSTNENNRSYASVSSIVRNDDAYARLLAAAKRDMAIFKERYKSLKELENIISEIDILLAE